jgi:nicotinate phosphoribosyltransferase
MKTTQRNLAEGFLYTDFYELTMAQAYYRTGIHEKRAQFDYFFRTYPDYGAHQAGYCINAGLSWLLDWLEEAKPTRGDIDHLRAQKGRSGKPLFDQDFLDWLAQQHPIESLSIRAVPEGRVIHPAVPTVVVSGPLAMAQVIESSVLNHLNYQTLIATKAARIKEAGRGRLMIEFGMRRAADRAATAGARAALVGGADFTSNTGLSCAMGVPPKGTHAHSLVQVFMGLGEGELGAFQAYADVYPDDCLLLVDTINTLESGVPNAIRVFEDLRRRGHEPMGIRLDSGDLAYLSIRAGAMLNKAGFPDTSIVLSNKLDEHVLMQIIGQIRDEAPRYGMDPDHLIGRLVYGVGTRLITSAGETALDGVYKLVAVEHEGRRVPTLKVSETPGKTLNPGDKSVWRLYDRGGRATADCIALADETVEKRSALSLHHPSMTSKQRTLRREELTGVEPLLTEVLDKGERVADPPSLEEIRRMRDYDLARLDSGVKRFVNPHVYHVSLTQCLWELKQELIASARME